MIFPTLPVDYQITAEKLYAEISTRIIGKLPQWDLAIAAAQIAKLRSFLNHSREALGDQPFMLELTQEIDEGHPLLTPHAIAEANRGEASMIRLSRGLHIIEVVNASLPEDNDPDEVAACDLSEGKVVLFYEQRCLARFFANGRTVGTIDPQAMSNRPGRYARLSRRPEHYEDAILDHYRSRIRDWQSDHWADRQRRILAQGAGRRFAQRIFFRIHSLNG